MMKKEYYEIRRENKDVHCALVINGSRIVFLLAFNSIGGTYYGLKVETFIESIMVLLRHFPTFFDEIDNHARLSDWAVNNDFVRREPTEHELFLYGK